MNRVAVTGASGFIGQCLLCQLVTDGFEVVAISRSGVANSSVHDARVTAYDDPAALAKFLYGVSTVIHLAARAHQMDEKSMGARERYFEANVASTISLVKASKIAGVRRFILMSSIGVNGNRTFGTPFTEDDPPAPVELYAASKLAAEQALGLETSAQGDLDYVVIRPPLVIGRHAPGNFGRLMSAVANGQILPLGAIHNRRSFVGLDNLIDFIVTCMTHPLAANQTFLISDGVDISTTELVHRMGLALGRPARLIPLPVSMLVAGAALLGKRAMAQRLCDSLQVDISKARMLLGWSAPVNVDEGLRRAAATS